jgi:hypothetical protein
MRQVFDPFLFQFVTQNYEATAAFSVAKPLTAQDYIDPGIDPIVRRDLSGARTAFIQALVRNPTSQPAALLLALTRIAILIDSTLPGTDPALLDSAGEFLDALGSRGGTPPHLKLPQHPLASLKRDDRWSLAFSTI